MKSYNVVVYDINRNVFSAYDIMPYLVRCVNEKKPKNRPKTRDEYTKFIKAESLCQWWSRCEYEIVLSDWPNGKIHEKKDVYWQIMMNIEVITDLLIENVKEIRKNERKRKTADKEEKVGKLPDE